MAKILVIDDEPTVRELIGRLLRRQGYDVVLAESGEKGLELFREEHPDVIVLDLKMPGMDSTAHRSRTGEKTRCRSLPY